MSQKNIRVNKLEKNKFKWTIRGKQIKQQQQGQKYKKK